MSISASVHSYERFFCSQFFKWLKLKVLIASLINFSQCCQWLMVENSSQVSSLEVLFICWAHQISTISLENRSSFEQSSISSGMPFLEDLNILLSNHGTNVGNSKKEKIIAGTYWHFRHEPCVALLCALFRTVFAHAKLLIYCTFLFKVCELLVAAVNGSKWL